MPAAALPSDLSASHELLHALLAVSLPGIILFRPVYADDDPATVVDLAYVHLNPAAQHMLRLPAQPPETFLTLYPSARETGIFAFYRDAFLSGEPSEYAVDYSYDGLDNFFQLTARRSGGLLVVGFTDTAAPDRSAVEQALRESQAAQQAARAEAERQRQRFYDVLMQLPAQVATYHGPEHVYQFVNGRYSQFVAQHELLGRTVREAGQGAVPDEVFALMDQVYATGEPMQRREVAVVLDRYQAGPTAPLFIDAFYLPLRNAAGAIDGVLDFSYDVTEQVLARRQVQQLNQEAQAAQAAAEAQRQRFYDVLLRLPAQVAAYHGPDHVYEFVNPRYQQYFAAQTLLGRSIREVIPGVGEQGIFALMDRVYQTGESFANPEVEAWVDFAGTGHPQQVFLNLSFHALRDAQGRIDGLLDFSYDVTEQVRARRQVEQLNQELETRVQERTQQVEQQRGELRRLFEQVPLAIVVLRGPTFIIEQANEYAAAVWGHPVAEVLGRPHFEALPEAAGQGYEELLTGVLQSGQPLVLHEVVVELARAHTGQPDTGYYNIVFKPLRDERQQVECVAVIWTEVTEQVRARQQVEQLNQELGAANEQLRRTNVDLDTFVYTASHDLKAPITNIEGILLALRAELPAAVQQQEMVAQLLDMLQTTVGRFQLTIAQLTDITKLQLAHAGPAEPVPLAQVVEDVCLDLGPLIAAASATLTVAVAPGLVVSFSPANLRSIVYNLLSNAVKYRSPDRPVQVRLRAEATAQAVVLTVQDNGLGMSEVQQRQLFGLFQRLHTHVEGTGVGLYIVKRLVENGGGTIAVQSQPDAGTTFTVTFPA